MAVLFRRGPIDVFITDFVAHSKSLKRGKFTKENIGELVFPGNQHPKIRLWECYAEKSTRALDGANLQSILDACRQLLRDQLKSLGESDPNAGVAAFEKRVCRKLNLRPAKATPDDFRFDTCSAEALSVADFGIPNILDWPNETFPSLDDLQAVQDRSIPTLREVVDHITRETDDHRRIKLLHIAVSILYVNHPGTRWHDTAINLALTAASQAHLPLLAKGRHITDDLQHPATWLTFHLSSGGFLPTLDSPFNYLRYALGGQRMPEQIWRGARDSLEESIIAANRYTEMRPNDEFAIAMRSGSMSMKARFLAVTGGTGDLRTADSLQKQSLRDLDRISVPYGFAYPVLKNIVLSKLKAAIRCCEQAAEACDRAGARTSAVAFAALQFHLTAAYGRQPTSDSQLRQLAAESLTSPAVRYKCSHICDVAAVQALLAKPNHPRSTPDRERNRLAPGRG
jgi:hypothetical protein